MLRVSGAFPKCETRNPNVTGGANDMVDWLNRKCIIHLLQGAVNRLLRRGLQNTFARLSNPGNRTTFSAYLPSSPLCKPFYKRLDQAENSIFQNWLQSKQNIADSLFLPLLEHPVPLLLGQPPRNINIAGA